MRLYYIRDGVSDTQRRGNVSMDRTISHHNSLYLTVEEVALWFGVNVSTVYRLAQQGQLPGFKLGSQWRFSKVRLEEWVANRERIG